MLERPNVGFVTAVDAYVHAKVKFTGGEILGMNAPQLNARADGIIDLDTGILSVDVPKELVLLKTSVEVAMRYAACKGVRLHGMSIETSNDAAFSYTVRGGTVAMVQRLQGMARNLFSGHWQEADSRLEA